MKEIILLNEKKEIVRVVGTATAKELQRKALGTQNK